MLIEKTSQNTSPYVQRLLVHLFKFMDLYLRNTELGEPVSLFCLSHAAREGANIEHEKKLSTLQSLEYRGGGEAKLDKTEGICKEAAVNDFANITAVSATSSVSVQVRDTELTPQLGNSILLVQFLL
ncbi:hypothetical protein MKX03_006813 [Papaver bracteatum]|nr:hypothetical protein MKX03_006813 [Papaver bracteatum]